MNIADNEAELQLKDVAELCGVSTKTLRRDHDAELLDMVKRDGRWVVTVASLIVAGRHTSSTEPASDRLNKSKLEARIRELEAQVIAKQRECAHLDDTVARLENDVAFLRRSILLALQGGK